jgi:hypothetical protein
MCTSSFFLSSLPVLTYRLKGNVLVMDDLRCCIVNLRTCKYLTEGDYNHKLEVSPGFEPPELLDFVRFPKPLMTARDIYGFGNMIYEVYVLMNFRYPSHIEIPTSVQMYTGQELCKGYYSMRAIRSIIRQGLRSNWPAGTKVPHKIIELVDRCWVEDSYARPTAKQIAELLQLWIDAGSDGISDF